MTGGFDELFGDTSTATAAPTEKKAKTADSAARPAAVDRPQQSQADHDGEVRAAADRYVRRAVDQTYPTHGIRHTPR